jgi:ribosomal protein S8
MRLSVSKDILLRYHVAQKDKDQYSKLEDWEKQDALIDLEKEGYIKTIETTSTGTGNGRHYRFETFYPKAKAFVEKDKRFRREERRQWWRDFPKNYWVVGVILATLISQWKPIYDLWQKPDKSQIELTLKPGIKSDTINLIYQKK